MQEGSGGLQASSPSLEPIEPEQCARWSSDGRTGGEERATDVARLLCVVLININAE